MVNIIWTKRGKVKWLFQSSGSSKLTMGTGRLYLRERQVW